MNDNLSDAQLRSLRIKRQSHNPFGKNYSTKVRSSRNLNLVPNSKGNQLHHNRIVDVLEAFFTGNDAEDLATVDHLRQRGVYVGNADKNLTAIPPNKHQVGNDTIHRFAIENNIQANLKGIQNSPALNGGNGFEYINSVRNKVRNLPFKERIKALDVFIDQIQPALDEKMASMGFSQPSREANVLEWVEQVNAEHDAIVANYLAKKAAGINTKEEKFKQKKLDKIIALVRSQQ